MWEITERASHKKTRTSSQPFLDCGMRNIAWENPRHESRTEGHYPTKEAGGAALPRSAGKETLPLKLGLKRNIMFLEFA